MKNLMRNTERSVKSDVASIKYI